MVLFQDKEDQPAIQMDITEKKGGASAYQKGKAAEMRTYVNENVKGKMNECLFKDLSYIIHSGDRNPQKAGNNRFADPENKYDPEADKILHFANQNIRQVVKLRKKGTVFSADPNCPRDEFSGRGEYEPYETAEYMEQLSGGKMNTKLMREFLDASYADKGKAPQNIDGYVRDNSLSGERVSVYYNATTGKAVVVHRGSKDMADWGNNLKMALGWKMSSTKRFKHAKDIQKKAEAKYGKKNVITLGHSLGGKIASDVGGDSDEIITLNKATGIGWDAYKKEHGSKSNETNVRTTLDPVSAKGTLDADFTIPSKSLNPIKEHGTGVLDRVDKEVGKGRSFTRKDYMKLNKKQLKEIIKSLPKLRDGFRLTGAGKPMLVDYLECRCCGK